MSRAPYALYGVKFIDPVPPARLSLFRPPLLHSVKLEAKLMFLEENDNVDDLDGGAENWEVVGVADKRIGSFIFTIE